MSRDKQEAFHLYPKYKQSKKRKNETEDKENQDVGNTEAGPSENGDDVSLPVPAQGQCALCGLKFDQNSKKVNMTEKTRETGQTFGDMLYELFQDDTLPPSLTEKAKSIELDEGFLCTLCVSYVDQMDVFQKKLSEIRSSILDVFIQKSKRESLIQTQVKSVKPDCREEPKVPKRRGRPPKPKPETVESPLKKSGNIERKSSEIIKQSELPEEDSANLAHKLSILSGIEIKRVNTETGRESEARIELGNSLAEQKIVKKKSPKKIIPLSETSDSSFAEACDTLEDELRPLTEEPPDLVTPVRSNISSRGRRPTSSRGRGQGRGRGTPTPAAVTPRLPPAKSKKSLFELSQERKKLNQITPPYIVNGIQLSPSPAAAGVQGESRVYSVPVSPAVTPVTPAVSHVNPTVTSSGTPSTPAVTSVTPVVTSAGAPVFPAVTPTGTPVSPAVQTPEEIKQKKAYRKLVARIKGVHPELTTDEAVQGIITVRDSNNGTLTGMSMQEIITRVRESVPEQSPPIGEEFEKMVFAPLRENPPAPPVQQAVKLFEMKCQFCSRMFKSSSEVATKKVYEIHLHEHEIENRNVFEDLDRNTGELNDNNKERDDDDTDVDLTRSDTNTPEVKVTEPKSSDEISRESPDCPDCRPSEPGQAADPVRSELSYCKICLKQFKNSRLYGIHQNTEHAAEKEFEKISNSS